MLFIIHDEPVIYLIGKKDKFILPCNLNYLIDQLKEDIGEVIFLGIQPDIVGFYYPMTQPIKDAVETVYQRLEGWEGNGGFAQLAVEEE